jgi:hypothetical protein
MSDKELKYFLDHPQIKRHESVGNGKSPRVDKDKMPCNKPRRSPKEGKSKVVKACEGGKEKIVHYGDPDMKIKKSNPKRKKSYCARSGGIKGGKGKLSANHWSRKAWDC